MKILKTLYSVFVWLLILSITIVFALSYTLVWLLTFPFDRRLWVLNSYATIWGSSFTFLNPVFKMPIYGWLMHLKGDIKLQRSSKSSIKKMLLDTEKVLNKNCSATIFPEGTRSRTGEIGNFKEGAFRLAQNTNVPIIPVIIYGTDQPFVYSKLLFRGKHKVKMKVLDEIPYSEFENLEISEFSKMVKSVMIRELLKLKEETNGC